MAILSSQWWRRLVVAGFLGAAVCAAPVNAFDRVGDPADGPLAEGEGAVIVAVTLNTSRVSPFETLVLAQVLPQGSDEKPGRFFFRSKVNSLSRDTNLFIGTLPAGEYRLALLSDESTNRYFEFPDIGNDAAGIIRVEAGATVDLGRLVITDYGNNGALAGRSGHARDNRELVARFAIRYDRLYDRKVVDGWPAPSASSLAEVFAMRQPAGVDGPVELPDGTLLAGSRMGAIVKRGTNGQWSLFGRTGGLDAIHWIAPVDDAEAIAYAVGDNNTLARVLKDGKVEVVPPGNLPGGNLFFAARSPDRKEWIVGLQTMIDAGFYRSDSIENGHWTRLRGEHIASYEWIVKPTVRAWVGSEGIEYAVLGTDRMGCYSWATREWQDARLPSRREFVSVAALPDGRVGAAVTAGWGSGGAGQKAMLGSQCGRQWQDLRSSYDRPLLPPLVFADGQMLESNGKQVKSKGGVGNAWTVANPAHGFHRDVWVFPSGAILTIRKETYPELRSWWLFSPDRGANWYSELADGVIKP